MTDTRYQIRLQFIHYILDNFVIYKAKDELFFFYDDFTSLERIYCKMAQSEQQVMDYFKNAKANHKATCTLHFGTKGDIRLDFEDDYLHYICLGKNNVYTNDIALETVNRVQIIHNEYEDLIDFLNGKELVQRPSNC